jgi:hypothetical protein
LSAENPSKSVKISDFDATNTKCLSASILGQKKSKFAKPQVLRSKKPSVFADFDATKQSIRKSSIFDASKS